MCVVAKICKPGKCSSRAGMTRRCQVGMQVVFDFVDEENGGLFFPVIRKAVVMEHFECQPLNPQ